MVETDSTSDAPLVASRAAREAARVIDGSAGRRTATPVRKVFVRAIEPGVASPMLVLYRGGRSGVVPIRLYLALLWRNSAPPHASDYTHTGWATLLDLPDPSGAGARRIAAAVARLEALQLIEVAREPGHPQTITIRAEDGRSRYTLPGAAYARAEKNRRGELVKARHRYFRLSSRLWTSGTLQSLSGPALVMLLIILAEWTSTSNEVWFSTKAFDERYGLSAPTRAAGVRELHQRGLIDIEERSLGDWQGATVFNPKRRRQVYTLRGMALPPSDEPLEITAAPTSGARRLRRLPPAAR